jgi:hypothetical protein
MNADEVTPALGHFQNDHAFEKIRVQANEVLPQCLAALGMGPMLHYQLALNIAPQRAKKPLPHEGDNMSPNARSHATSPTSSPPIETVCMPERTK